jgi:pentatricopeptide repeat protein
MIAALKLVTNYVVFGLVESFWGTCFGHAFSKACQYAKALNMYLSMLSKEICKPC